jgi:hypothetical protein
MPRFLRKIAGPTLIVLILLFMISAVKSNDEDLGLVSIGNDFLNDAKNEILPKIILDLRKEVIPSHSSDGLTLSNLVVANLNMDILNSKITFAAPDLIKFKIYGLTLTLQGNFQYRKHLIRTSGIITASASNALLEITIRLRRDSSKKFDIVMIDSVINLGEFKPKVGGSPLSPVINLVTRLFKEKIKSTVEKKIKEEIFPKQMIKVSQVLDNKIKKDFPIKRTNFIMSYNLSDNPSITSERIIIRFAGMLRKTDGSFESQIVDPYAAPFKFPVIEGLQDRKIVIMISEKLLGMALVVASDSGKLKFSLQDKHLTGINSSKFLKFVLPSRMKAREWNAAYPGLGKLLGDESAVKFECGLIREFRRFTIKPNGISTNPNMLCELRDGVSSDLLFSHIISLDLNFDAKVNTEENLIALRVKTLKVNDIVDQPSGKQESSLLREAIYTVDFFRDLLEGFGFFTFEGFPCEIFIPPVPRISLSDPQIILMDSVLVVQANPIYFYE